MALPNDPLTVFVLTACGATVAAVLVANLGLFGVDPNAAFARFGMTVVLAEVVGLLVYLVRRKSPSIKLSIVLPRQFAALDPADLAWTDVCSLVIRAGSLKQKVSTRIEVVRSRVGAGFEVFLPATVMARLTGEETLELSLTDVKGIKWQVEAFNPFDNKVELRLSTSQARDKFLAAYQGADQ